MVVSSLSPDLRCLTPVLCTGFGDRSTGFCCYRRGRQTWCRPQYCGRDAVHQANRRKRCVVRNETGLLLIANHRHRIETCRTVGERKSKTTLKSIYLPGVPLPRTRLLGRENDREAARALILDEGVPLLTLVGPGGVGKTRLALAIATDVSDSFAEGVVWVDLSSLMDPDLVSVTVAEVLNLHRPPGRPVIEVLLQALRPRQLLLLLDNCEHVLDQVAALVDALLLQCPALQVLATSRVPMRLRVEQRLPVEPLSVPALEPFSMQRLSRNEAVQLFVDRGRAVRPGFTLKEDDARAVAALCRQLDGLPLAIELVAGHLSALSPDALLAQLSDRLRVLRDGPRDLPTRQQTIGHTIAWSYDLLDPPLQTLFRQLCVFAGGFTPEAAEAVVSGDASAIDITSGLSRLVDHSLLHHPDTCGAPRFMMLETVRAFGLQQLVELGEDEETRSRHAAYFGALVARLDLDHSVPGDPAWMPIVLAEQDNLRQVLGWHASRGEALALNVLSGAMYNVWMPRVQLDEGRHWLEQAVAQEDETIPLRTRSRVHSAAGFLALFQGDVDAAARDIEEGLVLAHAAGEPFRLSVALLERAVLASRQHEPALAATMNTEAELVARTITPATRASQLLVAIALFNLGDLAQEAGDFEVARMRLQEAVRVQRALGSPWGLDGALSSLGATEYLSGDVTKGMRSLIESVGISWHTGNDVQLTTSLRRIAEVAAATKQPEPALRLLHAADRIDHDRGRDVSAYDQRIAARCLARLREVGGGKTQLPLPATKDATLITTDDAVASAREVGAKLLGEAGLAEAWVSSGAPIPVLSTEQDAGGGDAPPTRAHVEKLTPREAEVLLLLCQHLTDAEIANQLFIGVRTVEFHVRSILGKLGATNRRDAAAIAASMSVA